MALKSPMLPSPQNNLVSAFSPYSDSPTSPQKFDSPTGNSSSSNPSNRSSHLHPHHRTSSLANSPDIADPSPVSTSSNDTTGTNTTDIDDTAAAEVEEAEQTPEPPKSAKPDLELETKQAAEDASKPRSDEDEQPSSVIHAPQGYDAFARKSPPSARRSTPTPSQRSEIVVSPPDDEPEKEEGDETADKKRSPASDRKSDDNSPASPPPLQTSVAPAHDWSATPRAQSRQEMNSSPEEERRRSSRSSSRSSNLADIPEVEDPNRTPNPNGSSLFDHTVERLKEQNNEVAALKVALKECWTLCNTLAGLSYVHRERIFSFSGKGDRQEQAWKSCWKLCQKLYETRDEEVTTQVRPTLELCREFCQCLFDIRRKDNEAADSVLRVSFELNNHLFNTHDRTLPEAFRERTLDFYITLCHRLMKQRSEIARETDSLLGACWSLAEMLFSLRQNKREQKPADEELLGSAVQACWELCDLFREGWTQIRPDRGTPRPSQTTFIQQQRAASAQQAVQSTTASTIPSVAEYDENELYEDDIGRLNPETPTTIFEDTNQISPDEGPVPNILVLGPDQQAPQQRPSTHLKRSKSAGNTATSSSASTSTNTIVNPSSISHTIHTNPSSSATITNGTTTIAEDPHITCLHLLLIKAALNTGFSRTSSTPLTSWVKSLPSNSFGTKTWQRELLASYKKLIATDPAFKGGRKLGPPRRARAVDVARSVRWMEARASMPQGKVGVNGNGGGEGQTTAAQWGWLGDLYSGLYLSDRDVWTTFEEGTWEACPVYLFDRYGRFDEAYGEYAEKEGGG